VFATRCPYCGGRTEPVSETWETGGRLVRVRACASCGRESARETRWEGRRPPSESARTRGAVRAALWGGGTLAILWIILRLTDYGGRSSLYAGVAATLEAFRHPGWAALLVVFTVLVLLRARRLRATPVGSPLVEYVQLRAGENTLAVSVFEGHEGTGHDHEAPRDRELEETVRARFAALGRGAALGGDSDGVRLAGESRRALRSLGTDLGTLLGKDGAAGRAIVDSAATHMSLRVPRELSDIPWELAVLREGSGALWRIFGIARQAVVPTARRRGARRRRLPLRVLLLADLERGVPGRELPEAAREASELMELGAKRPEVLRIVRRTPRTAAELVQLLDEGFDIIHFAGHGGAPDGEAAWTLADGVTVAPAALKAPVEPPALVFSNACVSAGGGVGLGGELAEAFLSWGTQAYVGPLWELSDHGGAAFAREFYEALADGATLGMAMQAAKIASAAANSLAWLGYVLYGDPTAAPASDGPEQL